MARVLVLAADLPFFPGKNGHDFFNVRHLATRHEVGVVGPRHPHYPDEGVCNLLAAVDATYLWPFPPRPNALFPLEAGDRPLSGAWRVAGGAGRKLALRALLGLLREPREAFGQLAMLANCAPHLLNALDDRPWNALVVLQTNTAPWLDYLPASPAKVVLFHDVRSDYLERSGGAGGLLGRLDLDGVARDEARWTRESDVAVFLSDLDLGRARERFGPLPRAAVAPIPVDLDYFHPAPPTWQRTSAQPTVLFTGHLSHPPNVDAVEFLLADIWPQVRAWVPGARLVIAGLVPAERVRAACAAAAGVELHPNVPDIRPFYWDADVYVVPMRFGGGVRQKILEAWGVGVPVVSTPMGAEGLEAQHHATCYLEDGPDAFAERVARLLANPACARAVVARARQTVRDTHAIDVAARRFEQAVAHAPAIRRNRPFRLLLDLRWMAIGRAGGLEQMAYELVDGIGRLDRTNEYRVLAPRSTYHEWRFPPGFACRPFFSDAPGLEGIRASLVNGLIRELGRPPILTPEMRMLGQLSRMDFDLVHSLCSYSFPEMRAYPNVLTVHDLQHVHHPGFFQPDEWRVRDGAYRDSCARAQHIICISEYTRQDLHQCYGVPLEKTSTVWNIPSRAAWVALPAGRARTLLAGMGVDTPYLFFPSHGWAHKNHERLVEAFARAAEALPGDLSLLFTGQPFGPDHPAAAAIARHRLERRVRHLGYRSTAEVRALYGGATALVYPSLFEGFGMPVVEAMIAGCPVTCSSATSLPEVAGDAAHYFDPEDVDDIARALVAVSTDEEARRHLVREGEKRRPRFGVRGAVVKTLSVYRRVFEAHYS